MASDFNFCPFEWLRSERGQLNENKKKWNGIVGSFFWNVKYELLLCSQTQAVLTEFHRIPCEEHKKKFNIIWKKIQIFSNKVSTKIVS